MTTYTKKDMIIRHRNYSLTLRAALTKKLDRLSQIRDIDYLEIMDLALTVNMEEQARFLLTVSICRPDITKLLHRSGRASRKKLTPVTRKGWNTLFMAGV